MGRCYVECCGVCDCEIEYTEKDLSPEGTLVCPDCGSTQCPCAMCIATNDKLKTGLKCNSEHLARVEVLKANMPTDIRM